MATIDFDVERPAYRGRLVAGISRLSRLVQAPPAARAGRLRIAELCPAWRDDLGLSPGDVGGGDLPAPSSVTRSPWS